MNTPEKRYTVTLPNNTEKEMVRSVLEKYLLDNGFGVLEAIAWGMTAAELTVHSIDKTKSIIIKKI